MKRILIIYLLLISGASYAQTFLKESEVRLNMPLTFNLVMKKESQSIKTELIRSKETPQIVNLIVASTVNGDPTHHFLKLNFKNLRPIEEGLEDSYYLKIKVTLATKFRVEYSYEIEGPAEINTNKYFGQIFQFEYR